MIAIPVAATICGADDRVSVAAFTRVKEIWFRVQSRVIMYLEEVVLSSVSERF